MILILIPLKPEFLHFKTALQKALTQKSEEKLIANHPVTCFGEQLVVARAGHGKVEFALTAFSLCQLLKPKLLICLGGSGALDAGLRPGDLVVGEACVEHDFKVQFSKVSLPKFQADKDTVEKLRELARQYAKGYAVHFGSIAGGDEDVISDSRREEIKTNTGALAVAWEGCGGARAAKRSNTPFLEIRAVTDSANPEAFNDFLKHLEVGMGNAASLIARFVN